MIKISLVCPNGRVVTHDVQEAEHHTISVSSDGLRTVKFWRTAPLETYSSVLEKGLEGEDGSPDEWSSATKAMLKPSGLISTLSVPQTFVLQVTPRPDENCK